MEITEWIKNDRLRYFKVFFQFVEMWLCRQIYFSLNFIDIATGLQSNEGWKHRPHPVRLQVAVLGDDLQIGHRKKYFVLQRRIRTGVLDDSGYFELEADNT